MKALIVTGSRHGLTASKEDYGLLFTPILSDVDLLIHGAADGVDTIFKELAIDNCIQQLEMPAQWSKHGPTAGPLRNQEMVKVCLALKACGWEVTAAAFPGPKSKGTKNCIKLLKDAGIPVEISNIGR